MYYYGSPNYYVNPNFYPTQYQPTQGYYPTSSQYYVDESEDYSMRQPLDLGTRWEVEEGGWRGVWTRRGNSNVFDARWTRQGARAITAVLRMQVQDNFVCISRRNSSDGNNCQYVGKIEGNRVTGTNVCDRGGGAWSGTILRNQVVDLGRRWEVQEGAWNAVWVRRRNSNTFDGRWTRQGATPITAVLVMEVDGNNVRISRRNSSDGNNCQYIGRIQGSNASGTFTCDQGGGQWTANIRGQ